MSNISSLALPNWEFFLYHQLLDMNRAARWADYMKYLGFLFPFYSYLP